VETIKKMESKRGNVDNVARGKEEEQEWELFIDVVTKQCGNGKNKNQNK
jgi:hypothetical protein